MKRLVFGAGSFVVIGRLYVSHIVQYRSGQSRNDMACGKYAVVQRSTVH